MKTTIRTTDTHSITPNPGLEEGQKVTHNGKTFTVTRATAYQAFFKGQAFSVPGASKASPVEIEIETDGNLVPVKVEAAKSQAPKGDEKEVKLAKLVELLEGEAKEQAAAKLAEYREEKAMRALEEKEAEIARLTAEIEAA